MRLPLLHQDGDVAVVEPGAARVREVSDRKLKVGVQAVVVRVRKEIDRALVAVADQAVVADRELRRTGSRPMTEMATGN